MKTKRFFLVLVAATAIGTTTAVHAQSGWIDGRQAAQRARIHDGIRSGELTRGEAGRLRRQQRRIARMARRFGADGYYTPSERRRLGRALDRSSERIHRFRHNDRARRRGHDRWYGGHRRHRPWRGYHHSTHTTEIRHYRAPAQTVAETSSSRSVELDRDGRRVTWSGSGLF